ncbi:MAG: 3-methyl-2-oxobutanoate hydroxymethyltransferase, partial [Deltaproteobacteria bacterium]
LGMVIQGLENTLPVTLDEIIYHTKAVCRGVTRAFVVADMPFGSYQNSVEEGKRSAFRLIKESGAQAVKLEGGRNVASTIAAITEMDVPVMGHIGLTPQSIHRFGGFRVQGRSNGARQRLLDDARAVEEAGAFSVVLEGMPGDLAREITESLSIPTIGIGAGLHCDGQVLVFHDLVGMFDGFTPKFVKRYANLSDVIAKAVRHYVEEVKEGAFPGEEHSYS